MSHKAPLPPAVASLVRATIRGIDDQFDAVGNACNPSAGGGDGDPDRFAQCRFSDMSSNVTTTDPEGRRVRSTSSPEYAALNIGISTGRMIWEFKMEEDSHGGECQCLGFCLKPVTNFSYDSSGNNMWLWRGYNGQLVRVCSHACPRARPAHQRSHPAATDPARSTSAAAPPPASPATTPVRRCDLSWTW